MAPSGSSNKSIGGNLIVPFNSGIERRHSFGSTSSDRSKTSSTFGTSLDRAATSSRESKQNQPTVDQMLTDVEQKLSLAEKNLDASKVSLDSLNDSGQQGFQLVVSSETDQHSIDQIGQINSLKSKSMILFGDEQADPETDGLVFLSSQSLSRRKSSVSDVSSDQRERVDAILSLPRAPKISTKEVTDRLTDKSNFPASYKAKLSATSASNLSVGKSSEKLDSNYSLKPATSANSDVFERLSKPQSDKRKTPSSAMQSNEAAQSNIKPKETIDFFNTAT